MSLRASERSRSFLPVNKWKKVNFYFFLFEKKGANYCPGPALLSPFILRVVAKKKVVISCKAERGKMTESAQDGQRLHEELKRALKKINAVQETIETIKDGINETGKCIYALYMATSGGEKKVKFISSDDAVDPVLGSNKKKNGKERSAVELEEQQRKKRRINDKAAATAAAATAVPTTVSTDKSALLKRKNGTSDAATHALMSGEDLKVLIDAAKELGLKLINKPHMGSGGSDREEDEDATTDRKFLAELRSRETGEHLFYRIRRDKQGQLRITPLPKTSIAKYFNLFHTETGVYRINMRVARAFGNRYGRPNGSFRAIYPDAYYTEKTTGLVAEEARAARDVDTLLAECNRKEMSQEDATTPVDATAQEPVEERMIDLTLESTAAPVSSSPPPPPSPPALDDSPAGISSVASNMGRLGSYFSS
jgi:hypothetical protein